MDKIETDDLKSMGRALLPLAITKSGNYGWMYGTVCISPSIEKTVVKIEGTIIDGKVRKKTLGSRKPLDGGFVMWAGSWELFDLPARTYTLELKALDKEGKVVTFRSEKMLHGTPNVLTKDQTVVKIGRQVK